MAIEPKKSHLIIYQTAVSDFAVKPSWVLRQSVWSVFHQGRTACLRYSTEIPRRQKSDHSLLYSHLIALVTNFRQEAAMIILYCPAFHWVSGKSLPLPWSLHDHSNCCHIINDLRGRMEALAGEAIHRLPSVTIQLEQYPTHNGCSLLKRSLQLLLNCQWPVTLSFSGDSAAALYPLSYPLSRNGPPLGEFKISSEWRAGRRLHLGSLALRVSLAFFTPHAPS